MLTKQIRKKVSKKKVRYKEENFDLDLTYITDRIIAMGYPSSGTEQLYRNPREQVKQLLDKNHDRNYLVINLCSEKQYEKEFFEGRVEEWPFDDHNPPPMSNLLPWFRKLDDWLNKQPQNVAAIHCKAGKGRTGTIICAYLLHTKVCKTADEALKLYGSIRTMNGQGVTIPSQIRYVKYYEDCLKNGFPMKDQVVKLQQLIINTTPRYDLDGGCDPYMVIKQHGKKIYNSKDYEKPKHYVKAEKIVLLNNAGITLQGDVKFVLYDQDKLQKEKMCTFWINTNFISPDNPKLKLLKSELDKACKDKKCKNFDEAFSIELEFEIVQKGERAVKTQGKVPDLGTVNGVQESMLGDGVGALVNFGGSLKHANKTL